MTKKNAIQTLKLLLVWSVLIVVLGEVAVRLFVDLPKEYNDEKTSCFRYDAQLGWFPKEGAICEHSASITQHIEHNKAGFRDREHVPSENPKKSMAFFGDSFVWGYDVPADEVFTTDIQRFLPEWDIYNLGVSGYGTDQEYLLLQQWFPEHQPDVVFFVVHTNDSIDNATNYRDKYYKPYFTEENDSLVLQGAPVPTCYRYQQQQNPTLFKSHFVKGMAVLYNQLAKPEPIKVPNLQEKLLLAANEYVTSQGSEFRVVFTYDAKTSQDTLFLHEQNIPFQNLFTTHRFKDYGQHWTIEGHQYISSNIMAQLYWDGVVQDEEIAR